MRALVRGARHREWLIDRGVHLAEGDLRDYASLRRACHGAEGLVHCAAMVAHGAHVAREQRLINVDGTSNLYRAAGRAGVKRIVHVSSIIAVGCTREGRAVDENEPWTGRHQPAVHYAKTKREAEERAFAAAYSGLPITIVNPTAMVGRVAQTGDARGHVAAALAGVTRRVLPGGSSIAHVADVASGVAIALETGAPGERTILGGSDRTWFELRRSLAVAAGRRPPRGTWSTWIAPPLVTATHALELVGLGRPRFASDKFRAWGWHSYADSSKARRTLGYQIPPFDEVVARALSESGSQ